MRKISMTFTFLAAIVALTGCLKDKGFESQEYGIQIKEVKGVAFPESASSPVFFGVNSQTSALTVDGPAITLEQSGAASSDVHVTVQVNNTLVTDLSLTPLPAGSYSINSLNVTIAAGSKLSAPIQITLNNSSLLDPTVVYAVGLTITSADAGYIVAANQKNIVVAFTIKNQFDGKYRLKTRFYHPTAASTYPLLVTESIEMHTSGPNSVKIYSTIPGLVGYYHPWSTGSSITAFAGQEPEYTINPATNAVTVQNVAAGAVTFYEMGKGFDNAGYNSRYEAGTKTIFANFGYNLSAGQTFNPAASRMWTDTLIYMGPR